MNLSDLIVMEQLQQDEWSLTGGSEGQSPNFGKEGQLSVIGWSGKQGCAKIYILKCRKCSQDTELFGEGYFRSLKGNLANGYLPCGCSSSPRWSKEQFATLSTRKAKERGYTFLGFVGEWKMAYTKVKMLCEKHGEWGSGNINNLLNTGRGCPNCMAERIGEANAKPDDVMIASFFASGAFHPNTKFWRSDRKTSQGVKTYWFMSCPECGEQGEAACGNLQQGQLPCACSKHRQKEAYINWVLDEGVMPIAIKFGIARDSKKRASNQNSLSVYKIWQHSVYTFPDVASCKKAERECKKELDCGIVLKRDMGDGYTETTWAYNLEKIIEIYERNGGVKIEEQ